MGGPVPVGELALLQRDVNLPFVSSSAQRHNKLFRLAPRVPTRTAEWRRGAGFTECRAAEKASRATRGMRLCQSAHQSSCNRVQKRESREKERAAPTRIDIHVYPFIGVWQQDSGKGPRIADGAAKLRIRPNLSYSPPLESITGAVRSVGLPSPPNPSAGESGVGGDSSSAGSIQSVVGGRRVGAGGDKNNRSAR